MVPKLGGLDNFADSQEGSGVSLYHDVSTAPLLDLRRRLKMVVDLLSAMIRGDLLFSRMQFCGRGPFILLPLRTFC